MKKTILATSKRHGWICGALFTVEKFRDAGGDVRYQIVMGEPDWRGKPLISKRAIVAMANGQYARCGDGLIPIGPSDTWMYKLYKLTVPSAYGRFAKGSSLHQIARVAKKIIRELDIV